MAEKMGQDKIFRFRAKSSHLPEAVFYRQTGWTALQKVFQKGASKEDFSFLKVHAGKRRPTRIFSNPLILEPEWMTEGTDQNQGLAVVQIRNFKWKLVQRSESERIFIPWWEETPGAKPLQYSVRDYEVWTLENGVRLWMHRRPETHQWICTGLIE
jgi:hypothetical protein